MGALDTAINAVSAAEATYNADTATVSQIETAIAAAQAPLPGAQATQAQDAIAFNQSLDALAAAAQAAKVAVPSN